MRIGIESLNKKLEELGEKLQFLREPSMEFLNSYKDRIDKLYRAVVLFSFPSDVNASVAFNTEGDIILSVTLSDPFVKSPSPYRMQLADEKKLLEIFEEVFGKTPAEVKAGIFEFPPKTKFLAFIAPDKFANKLIFQEEIKGVKYISFAKDVDENFWKKLEEINGKYITEGSFSIVDDEGIHIAMLAPKDVEVLYIPLLSEMAKLIREKLELKPAKFSKMPRIKDKILITFSLPLESLSESNPKEIAVDFEKRLKEGFNSFIRGAKLI